MAGRQEIEAALSAWREAQRRLDEADGHHTEDMEREVEATRGAYQQIAADHMADRLDDLKEAESRRATSTPSSEPYHEAVREEQSIAADIWREAREMDTSSP